MAHKIPNQIAWLTNFVRLNPGDIVATGTFHEGLEPVNSGDTIEIEFANMGRAKFDGQRQQPAQRSRMASRQKPTDPTSRRRHAHGLIKERQKA